jgi:hypothetical protein
MAASQTHAGAQRQAAREQPLLRPQRDPEADVQALFHPQRVLGNAAFARSAPPSRRPDARSVDRGIGPIVQRSRLLVQPKLTLGPVDDVYEREADQVARQVVQRMSSPSLPPGTIQRQGEEEEELLQGSRAADGPSALDPGVERSIQTARAGGSPLPSPVRRSMEDSFGSDFSGVRVHTGPQSNELNQQLQARAFTTGRDIFFREGEYNPTSPTGQQLLAHELTHVVQQGAASSVRTKRLAIGRIQRQVAYDSLFFGHRLA